jgi:hypothetical protein
MRLSHHSIERFQQRVAPEASYLSAARQLSVLAGDATSRPWPRHWTPVSPSPGTTFLYPHARPDLCLIVRERVVITVVDRASARRWAAAEPPPARAVRPTSAVAYRRPAPGAWMHLDEAA